MANVKVMFKVLGDDGQEDVETVWAEPLGKDIYKVLNLLFFAYNVSIDDVIYAPMDDEHGLPRFMKVIEKSGNQTLRVILDSGLIYKLKNGRLLRELSEAGCGCEGANSSYFAINVPTSQSISAVTKLLSTFSVKWEFADPAANNIPPNQ